MLDDGYQIPGNFALTMQVKGRSVEGEELSF
jgi:hypothetical protein